MRLKCVLPREPGRERAVCVAFGFNGDETKLLLENERDDGFAGESL